MLCSYSKLDESTLKSIQKLEAELGKTLVSFTCQDVKPAAIDDGALGKIQKLEKELSISLVAVEA